MTAAKKLAANEAYLEAGHVERAGKALSVRLGDGVFEARRAKSCLVAPELGDRVLCAMERDHVFVLAVLEGHESSPTRLEAEGDLELQAPRGRISVRSSAGFDVVSGGEIAVTGAEVSVNAAQGTVAIEELGFFGRFLQAEVSKVAVVAHEIDSVVTRLSQRAKRVFRFVEEIDQTRAGTIDMRAEGLIGIRGENAVIAARVLAKVDGEIIHLG